MLASVYRCKTLAAFEEGKPCRGSKPTSAIIRPFKPGLAKERNTFDVGHVGKTPDARTESVRCVTLAVTREPENLPGKFVALQVHVAWTSAANRPSQKKQVPASGTPLLPVFREAA